MSPPLDYRPPEPDPWDWRRFAARWLGVGLVLFGSPFLLTGVVSMAQVFKGVNRFLRSGYPEQGGICLVLGAACLIVGTGWLRHGFAHAPDRDPPPGPADDDGTL